MNDRVPCGEVQGLLPWLINGSLSEEQDATVRVHLGGCPACRENLSLLEADWATVAATPTPGQLVEFVFGASEENDSGQDRGVSTSLLGADTRRALEVLAAVDPRLRKEIAALRESRQRMESAPDGVAAVPGSVHAVPGRWWSAAYAAAALLIALASGAIWVSQRGEISRLEMIVAELKRPRANVIAADVLPDSMLERNRASSSVSGLDPVAFRLDPEQDLTLILSYPQADPRRDYAVRLQGPGGLLWEIEGLAPSPTSDFTVTFPPGFLAPGSYRMEIYLPQESGDPDGVLRLERRYVFDIEPHR